MATVKLANNDTSSLAPDTDSSKQVLTDTVNANAIITAYCHSLQNIKIEKLKGQGEWYKVFNESLVTAQGHGRYWVETLSPKIFSTIPQSIINYGNIFSAAMKRVTDIVNSVPDGEDLTPAQSSAIVKYIQAVLGDLGLQQSTLTDIKNELIQFNNDVQNDHTALMDGQNGASAQVLMDQKQLTIIQAKITKIQNQMAADSAKAMVSEIGLGVAIFITVVAFAAAVATGGVSLGIGAALAVGVLGIGGSIAGAVIFSKEVNKDLDDLYNEQQNLNDEQRQLTSLQGVVNAIQTLVNGNVAATTAISAVLNTWAVLQKKLESVLTDLKAAQADAKAFSAILVGLDIDVAQTAWAQLVDFAENMQKSSLNIQVNVIQQPNPPTSKAA